MSTNTPNHQMPAGYDPKLRRLLPFLSCQGTPPTDIVILGYPCKDSLTHEQHAKVQKPTAHTGLICRRKPDPPNSHWLPGHGQLPTEPTENRAFTNKRLFDDRFRRPIFTPTGLTLKVAGVKARRARQEEFV